MMPMEQRSQPVLPNFRKLAAVACVSNLPFVLGVFVLGHAPLAFSISAGLMVGLTVYGLLYLFVGRGLDPFVSSIRGRAKPVAKGPTLLFTLMLPLKYLALGTLMWLLWRTGHLNWIWFAIGFLATQVSVTTATVIHLARRPRW